MICTGAVGMACEGGYGWVVVEDSVPDGGGGGGEIRRSTYLS